MRKRPFWQESDSTASFEDPFLLLADDARSRQQLIGARLRQSYQDIIDEPVPAEWLNLFNQDHDRPESRPALQSERAGEL